MFAKVEDFDVPIVVIVPIVRDNWVIGVGVCVGADDLPLFLLLGGVSWH